MQKQTSAQLKAAAKAQLMGNYPTVIGAICMMFLFSSLLTSILNKALLLSLTGKSLTLSVMVIFLELGVLVLSGMMQAGLSYMMLKLTAGQPIYTGDLFHCFIHNPGRIAKMSLYLGLILEALNFPGMLLNAVFLNHVSMGTSLAYKLVSFGTAILTVYVAILFSQIFYVAIDFPNYTPADCFKASITLMKGNKGRLFYIMISFLPFILLGLITFFVPYLWIVPYVEMTLAYFYLDIIRNRN